MYPLTECSFCGDRSTNMGIGNGCHACQRGVCKKIQDDYLHTIDLYMTVSRQHAKDWFNDDEGGK